jgi:hypothetical protein
MSTTLLSQDEYIAERKRETRRHRGIARAQLASARSEYAIRATPETRAKLVRCLATLYIAQAFCDALEDAK